jgi:hypothetical protein
MYLTPGCAEAVAFGESLRAGARRPPILAKVCGELRGGCRFWRKFARSCAETGNFGESLRRVARKAAAFGESLRGVPRKPEILEKVCAELRGSRKFWRKSARSCAEVFAKIGGLRGDAGRPPILAAGFVRIFRLKEDGKQGDTGMV